MDPVPGGLLLAMKGHRGACVALSAAIPFMDKLLISISCILGKLRARRVISVAPRSFLYYNDLNYSYLLM